MFDEDIEALCDDLALHGIDCQGEEIKALIKNHISEMIVHANNNSVYYDEADEYYNN